MSAELALPRPRRGDGGARPPALVQLSLWPPGVYDLGHPIGAESWSQKGSISTQCCRSFLLHRHNSTTRLNRTLAVAAERQERVADFAGVTMHQVNFA